jgi:hypothetical protein
MNRDDSPEHAPSPAALVDALVAQAAAFDRAMTRTDLSYVTVPELHERRELTRPHIGVAPLRSYDPREIVMAEFHLRGCVTL